MQLQRYLSKHDRVIYFGKHSIVNTWDFKWYIRKNQIGIAPNPSTEAESFISGFLVKDDKLIITPSQESPIIERKSDQFGTMYGRRSGTKEVYDLIKLIQRQETTHVFIASEYKDRSYGEILTFSPEAPPNKLYKPGKIMLIENRF